MERQERILAAVAGQAKFREAKQRNLRFASHLDRLARTGEIPAPVEWSLVQGGSADAEAMHFGFRISDFGHSALPQNPRLERAEKLIISVAETFFEVVVRKPTRGPEERGIEKLAGGAVRLGGIADDFSLETRNLGHDLRQSRDRDFLSAACIDEIGRIFELQEVMAGVRKIVQTNFLFSNEVINEPTPAWQTITLASE